MKTPVIDGLDRISVFGNAGSTRELAEIAGDFQDSGPAGLDALDKLLDSLPLEDKAANEIRDLASNIFAVGAESGFRRGFRVGMRLMVESLGAPEAPAETRPGA